MALKKSDSFIQEELIVKRKPWYKRWWAIVLFVYLGLIMISFMSTLITTPQKNICNLNEKCSSDYCKGYEYVACNIDINGCYVEAEPELVIGKCEVKCKNDDDCYYTRSCKGYICEDKDPLYQYNTCINDELKSNGYNDGINCIRNYNNPACEHLDRYNAEIRAVNKCNGL